MTWWQTVLAVVGALTLLASATVAVCVAVVARAARRPREMGRR